jgi:hypothetical protein
MLSKQGGEIPFFTIDADYRSEERRYSPILPRQELLPFKIELLSVE